MKILMMAGEVSGDVQGARLAAEMRALRPGVRLYGTGGEKMRAAGVEVLHGTTHLSTVGFLEPIRHLFPLHGIYGELAALVRREKPDLAILIDNQGFNLAMAKMLRRAGVPVVFYFPPQIWVGPGLFARSVAKNANLVISAFPLEAKIYRERYGAEAISFGHPLLDIAKPAADPDAALQHAGLDPDRPVIGLMPGSRTQEVRELARAMADAAAIIAAGRPDMQFVLPVAALHLHDQIVGSLRKAGMESRVHLLAGDYYGCLASCRLVLVCSGTATLELSLLGVPMIAAYRLDPASHWIARRLSLTPYVAMPNVLLGEMAVPEIIQYRITGNNFAAHALEMLRDPQRLASIRAKLALIPSHLGAPGAVRSAAQRIMADFMPGSNGESS